MKIVSARFVSSSTRVSQKPSERLPEFAFIGRSNVGKSSLINMLCSNSKLAKTSQTPGKTKLVNHFIINDKWYLVDLPGYGFAKRSKSTQQKIQQMISSYLLMRQQLANVFVLIDIRHSAQKIDLEFINWLGQSSIPFSIVFTKADKLSHAKAMENVKQYMETLSESWEELPPYFVTSSEKKLGRDELLAYIENINKDIANQ